ncbi:MAG: 2-oxoglutarate dehydrogenase complex dihydrolipoyllysine-residue succinyltransferase [Bacteroidales bacterium]|nr:2-oxoglutarate dehydrogenase complex dihydrolipoyllysine-residue succinyltransferase [Lentimicrobiaceae bacterium]MDD5693679.1 2-oxoglutarate dehydrogenase complex dihydrolipoyllysine-residue succinyltransferase [Bacteroidales bacterium]
MIIDVKVPSPGESIVQVQLASWLVSDGDHVQKDAEIAEIDSDKATLSITAEQEGILNILVPAGETIDIGTVIGRITATGVPGIEPAKRISETPPGDPPFEAKAEEARVSQPVHVSPLARKTMEENQITPQEMIERFGSYRISRKEVDQYEKSRTASSAPPEAVSGKPGQVIRETERQKMSTLRLKLSERLVEVKNQTAMLTTFNEVDMSMIIKIRNQYKEAFKQKFGISLGFMSFFTRAVTEALRLYPAVNAQIDGEYIVYHQFMDIGIAVSAPKGLVVPVLRNAESMTLAEIEIQIKELAERARANKITLEEMTGGTFTITNGGVFGSLMSTPILNPPQSAILGMHKVMDRPVAVNGKVEIHPMMFIALSYDHRIIDGRESVGFLVKVREMLEDPIKMMYKGDDPINVLLNL